MFSEASSLGVGICDISSRLLEIPEKQSLIWTVKWRMALWLWERKVYHCEGKVGVI